MSDARTDEKRLKNELYEIWLELGQVFHVLGNECDPDKGAELLEPTMERLEKLWR